MSSLALSAGDHEIRVQMAGKEVPRSPFRVRVADPRQVVVDCPSHASLGNNAHVKGMRTVNEYVCIKSYTRIKFVHVDLIHTCASLPGCVTWTMGYGHAMKISL